MMDKRNLSHVSPRDAALCKKLARLLIPVLRHKAYSCGYALAVHGSLRRDIDLVAIPWRDADVAPIAPRELAMKIRAICDAVCGFARMDSDDEFHLNGCPGKKPHGRLTWVFHLGGGPYIDLSVMSPEVGKP